MGAGRIMKEKNAEEKRALYWMCCCPCLGAVSIRKLGSHFGGYQELINIEETALDEARILTPTQKNGLLQWKKEFSGVDKRWYDWRAECHYTVVGVCKMRAPGGRRIITCQ